MPRKSSSASSASTSTATNKNASPSNTKTSSASTSRPKATGAKPRQTKNFQKPSPQRVPREDGPQFLDVADGQWTPPKTIIHSSPNDDRLMTRSGRGYRVQPSVIREFVGEDKQGIYEISVQKGPHKSVPVYVGKTKDATKRIGQYANRGAHLNDEINQALSDDFDVKLKFMPCDNPTAAEKKALQKYDYAWNKQLNK